MYFLQDLEPKQVFRYFEAICDLPHGSKNTKIISDYCVLFAKIRGLDYYQDQKNNVIIYKPAFPGYEDHEPVILQAHLDMVCEKENGVDIDFLKDGIKLKIENEMIKAEGTTLGADDGIAVATFLAILDDKNIPHPQLEVLFTTDEEIGMLGASFLDVKHLHAKKLLNMDSEKEGVFVCGCAGGVKSTLNLPVRREPLKGTQCTLHLHGFNGGHSGEEINNGHLSAIFSLAKFYDSIQDKLGSRIISFEAPGKDNAISREAKISFMTKNKLPMEFYEWISTFLDEIREVEPNADMGITFKDDIQATCLQKESADRVRLLFQRLPQGVIKMNDKIPTLVQTSLNCGVVQSDKNFVFTYSIRSSVNNEKRELANRIKGIINKLGGQYSENGEYPAWEYKENTPLQKLVRNTYKDLFGPEPELEVIHAGLECGLFSNKIQGLDCISFGPDTYDIHTPKEALSISSVERTWKFLLKVLENL